MDVLEERHRQYGTQRSRPDEAAQDMCITHEIDVATGMDVQSDDPRCEEAARRDGFHPGRRSRADLKDASFLRVDEGGKAP